MKKYIVKKRPQGTYLREGDILTQRFFFRGWYRSNRKYDPMEYNIVYLEDHPEYFTLLTDK